MTYPKDSAVNPFNRPPALFDPSRSPADREPGAELEGYTTLVHSSYLSTLLLENLLEEESFVHIFQVLLVSYRSIMIPATKTFSSSYLRHQQPLELKVWPEPAMSKEPVISFFNASPLKISITKKLSWVPPRHWGCSSSLTSNSNLTPQFCFGEIISINKILNEPLPVLWRTVIFVVNANVT